MALTYPTSGSPPAIQGGRPAFPDGLAFARPGLPPSPAVLGDVERILASGQLTNGPHVRKLEDRAAEYLGVRHCVAVSSCTSGLMLALRTSGLSGGVVVPSFTFAATAHAVAWNGLQPTFADIDESTHTLSPNAAARTIGVRTSAILATHTYGTPCDVEQLAEVAASNGVRLFFDAAHAFGSRRDGVHVGGFGDAEVFSLSPTKVLVAGEGGIIATNDDVLAERCRIGRNYGDPGDYDCRFVGLNARMSEVHAAIALASLEGIEERIVERNAIADRYHRALRDIPGIGFPSVRPGDRSTFKDLTILVDPVSFGMGADGLVEAMKAEGIETKRYYSPPVHAMRAYRTGVARNGGLKVTDWAAERVLSLPLWSGMTDEPDRVAEALARVNRHLAGSGSAEKIRRMMDAGAVGRSVL
jgi:dTDP-4-amino-4,6-dideoxygalactose transaminase